ncbi:MAG TPA: hypothetical protein VMU83_24230 [Hanamia sp.]|nr:hypothetical protein [Hanamia sp.]
MKKLTSILFFIAAITFYPSCKKGDTIVNPDPTTLDSATIMGFKDSTQLIKSMHRIDYDSTGAIMDTSTSYLYYDTLDRKITIRSGVSVGECSYNSLGLLVHLESSGDTTTSSLITEASSIDYTYDASNILKTASVKESNGESYVYSINKTLLPSGNYQLSWLDQLNLPDSNYYLVNVDTKGEMLSYYDYAGRSSDSIIYDATGNVSKVLETIYKTAYDTSGSFTFTLYDFLDRDTKGDQLYNFYKILFNGVFYIPGDISGFGGADVGNFYQDIKYRCLSTNITRPIGDLYCLGCGVHIVNFNNPAEYDSKNRLVEISNFFSDTELYRTDYTISYYK